MYYRLKDGRLVKKIQQGNGSWIYLWSYPYQATLEPPSKDMIERDSESIKDVMDYSWTNRCLIGYYREPDTILPQEKVEILIAQYTGLVVVAEYDHKRKDWFIK